MRTGWDGVGTGREVGVTFIVHTDLGSLSPHAALLNVSEIFFLSIFFEVGETGEPGVNQKQA